MMKAALGYYRDVMRQEKTALAPQTSFSSKPAASHLRAQSTLPGDLTPAERSFLKYVNGGQVGAVAAHHAPRAC